MTALAGLLGLAVLLAAVAAAAIGSAAAWAWRHDRSRFLVCLFGIAAAMAVAVPRAGAALGYGAAPMGMAAWLRLFADLAVAVLFLGLLATLARQDRAARRAASFAPVNDVTGLPNRSAFTARMVPALARCRREGAPVAIIAIAIDGLAEIEARRGPAAAADALRDLASILRETLRAGDLPGQIGPGILAALLPGTAAQAARALAERLRAAAAEQLPHPAMDGRRITISAGIAAPRDGVGPAVLDEALDAAAAALRRVAGTGGGVVLADPVPAPGATTMP